MREDEGGGRMREREDEEKEGAGRRGVIAGGKGEKKG